MNIVNIKDSIKEHEGFRSMVYNDHLGNPTIGYGFLIASLNLSRDISELILQEKLDNIIKELNEKVLFFNELPENVQNVIIEMSYQMGVGKIGGAHGFLSFRKAIEHLKNKEWQLAADDFMSGLWAPQTPGRAKELTDVIRNTGK